MNDARCISILFLLLGMLAGCNESSSSIESAQPSDTAIDSAPHEDSQAPAKKLVPVDWDKIKLGTFRDVKRVNYDQVKIGMRFEDVATLLGPTLEELSKAKSPDGIGVIEKMKWDQQWTEGFCIITFQANEVIAKEQSDLE
jgi:hypothetical protein